MPLYLQRTTLARRTPLDDTAHHVDGFDHSWIAVQTRRDASDRAASADVLLTMYPCKATKRHAARGAKDGAALHSSGATCWTRDFAAEAKMPHCRTAVA